MVVVSACLAGIKCRYDGNDVGNEKIKEMVAKGQAIPLCPEVLGGLSIPRDCCELLETECGEKKVVSTKGKDFTHCFQEGAQRALEITQIVGADVAYLKEKSPSCGKNWIYDGSFSGKIIPGEGLFAELLKNNGVKILTEQDLKETVVK